MKKISILLFATLMIFTSCNDDDDDKDTKSSAKVITEFVFEAEDNDGLSEDVKTTINQTAKTIVGVLPEGTSLTALKASIEISDDATIAPKEQVTTNFTEPIVYTVTAENDTTVTYTATITLEED